MANTITLRKNYSEALDEVYKLSSLTAVLDGDNTLVRAGANANEILVPKMSMSGLADYDRNAGFTSGNVTFEYETKECEYDRGRMFTVDAEDEEESLGAFSKLSAEFVRTKVVPELDAYRIGAYANAAGTAVTGTLTTGKAALDAVSTAKRKIIDSEANIATCYLFITADLRGMIDDLDTTASRRAMEDWAGIVVVPTARMFKTVKLGADGFTGTQAINFLAADKAAVMQFQKHTVSKIVTPDNNPDADAWKFGYRTVGIAEAYDNKKLGIYAHTVAAA